MANLIKIILGLNILAAVVGVFFGITKANKAHKLVTAIAIAEGEASKASAKLTAAESEKVDISKKFADKDAEHKAMKAQHDQLTKNSREKEAAFANLQQDNKGLNVEKQSWITERQALQDKANEAITKQAKFVELEEQVQKLTADLHKAKNPATPAKPKLKPLTVARDGKVGKIANVDPKYGFLLLNRGSAHGFKVGDQFNVFRNNKLIGRVKVSRLSPTNTGISVAQRTEGLGVPERAQFQPNDDLIKLQ